MPDLLRLNRVTHEMARDILERVYDRFLSEDELRNCAGEWEARESLAELMSNFEGPIARKEREDDERRIQEATAIGSPDYEIPG